MTPALCRSLCAGRVYAGVQNGNECFCGDQLGFAQRPASECDVACSGDSSVACGGPYRNSVYATSGGGGGGGGGGGAVMSGGAQLNPGQALLSPDGRFHLDYQTDGNLVLYQNGVGHLWHAHTHGTAPGRAAMQTDG